MKKQLEFEKVGDINSDFLIYAFTSREKMIRSWKLASRERRPSNSFFILDRKKLLSFSQWTEVAERARVFLKVEIANQAFE
ncbi:hypothetical protein TMM008_40330 [Pseudomonas sp. 008]|nr:hypothetical protein TMM008_40330 [Pseudomonas sp. 008]